jgi:hypothetical protein
MTVFSLPDKYLDPGLFGFGQQSGYDQARNPSYSILPVMSGKARYRLRNPSTSYFFNLIYDWSDHQLYLFEFFWNNRWNHGEDWFYVPLMFGQPLENGHPQLLIGLCHPTKEYTCRSLSAGRWEVRFEFQTHPMSFLPMPDLGCPIIYGGPIDFLATNDIWSDSVSNLPTNVIEPCNAVLNVGN